jgi:hypothetical protein
MNQLSAEARLAARDLLLAARRQPSQPGPPEAILGLPRRRPAKTLALRLARLFLASLKSRDPFEKARLVRGVEGLEQRFYLGLPLPARQPLLLGSRLAVAAPAVLPHAPPRTGATIYA